MSLSFLDSIPCRGFTVCYGAATANTTLNHPMTQTNHYSEKAWLEVGQVTVSNGTTDILCTAGQVNDLTAFKGQDVTATTGDEASLWVAFNPTDTSQPLNVEVITSDTAITGECSVFVLHGSMTVEEKTIDSWKYIYIREGVTKNITLTEGSKVAKVTIG